MKSFFVYFAISVSSFAEDPVSKGRNMLRAVSLFSLTALALVLVYADADAQSSLKKVRIGVSETHVGYLPLQVAFHKGYYKDEGIDLEIVLMATNVINTAALKQHKVKDRLLAEQMLGYSQKVVTKEAQVTNEEIQYLIDLMRANAKVSRPVTVGQVVDFSFLEKARKDLGLIR